MLCFIIFSNTATDGMFNPGTALQKALRAIKKAFRATGNEFNDEILELLSLRVTADFQPRMKDGSISVEEIQDSVEHVLEQTGYTDVAKAYILYIAVYHVLIVQQSAVHAADLLPLLPVKNISLCYIRVAGLLQHMLHAVLRGGKKVY